LIAEEGRVEELQQLLTSGVVKSLKVVDSDGHHVLNIAIQHKQDKVVQVRGKLNNRQKQWFRCRLYGLTGRTDGDGRRGGGRQAGRAWREW
jgi:hypothetical protein